MCQFGGLKLPWIQLTDLFFGNRVRIRQWTCLDILQQCPNLESCVFLRIKAISQNPSVHAQVLHSSLQSLQVGTHTSLSTFFDCLTLPALRNIHVACDPGYPQFVSFLARSLCHIERFVIDMPLPPRYFIQFIQSMPHLAELDIRVSLIYFVPQDASADDIGRQRRLRLVPATPRPSTIE
jgi:hypothetical protein